MKSRDELLQVAIESIHISAEALAAVAERLDTQLLQAVEGVLSGSGRVVVSGVGKSGHIASKIAGTLSSTGTPSHFLHPMDALHGDLGFCDPGDTAILISKSGSTAELLRLAPLLRQREVRLVAIVGNPRSRLAELADAVLDASIRRESDPHNLLPTASAHAALALGDAFAIALMVARGFTATDFHDAHPSGQIGRNLSLRVADVMHTGDAVAWVAPETLLKQLIVEMTRRPLGAACVVDESGLLLGLVTDGDLRRALVKHDDIRELRTADVMTRQPTTTSPEAVLGEALGLMEDRPSQISVMPVVDVDGRCAGLLRLHDIYHPHL
jgi:arabinose-5-phosphate isomerase